MKPVTINLMVKKNVWDRISLSLIAIIAVTSLGMTLVNLYDYRENIKVITAYESRIKEINKRLEQKKATGPKIDIKKQEREAFIKDLDYFGALIRKSMFSLPLVLTEIENAKQDKIDINAIVFSDTLMVLTIKGESDHMDSVSKFIIEMDRSKYFNIELSRQEINENKRIIFELTARWVSSENDPKI